jgi:thioredoxin reductase
MLPNIAGMSTFKGRQLHSREYRQPAAFKNQRVVIVGMGDSGSAIGAEISSVAAVTYFRYRCCPPSCHLSMSLTLIYSPTCLACPALHETNFP